MVVSGCECQQSFYLALGKLHFTQTGTHLLSADQFLHILMSIGSDEPTNGNALFNEADKFPTALQVNAHDCGYACVRILASYYGLFEVNYSLPETHLSIEDIMAFARRVGFSTHAFRTSYSWLYEKVPVPFIVHCRGDHFVVVHQINETQVGISDPSTGALRELTKREFVQSWLGHINGPGSWKNGVVVYLEKNTPDDK